MAQNQNDRNQTVIFGGSPAPAEAGAHQQSYSWWKWAFNKQQILQLHAQELGDKAQQLTQVKTECKFHKGKFAELYEWLTQRSAPDNLSVEDLKKSIEELFNNHQNKRADEAAANLQSLFPGCHTLEDVKKQLDMAVGMQQAAKHRLEQTERMLAEAQKPQAPIGTPAPQAYEEERAAMNKQLDQLRQTVASKDDSLAFKDRTIAEMRSQIAELQSRVATQAESMKNARQSEMSSVETDHVEKLNALKERHQKELDMLRNNNRLSIENLKKEHQKEIEDIQARCKDEISAVEASKTREIQQLEVKHIEEIKDKLRESDDAMKRLQLAAQQNIDKIKEDHYDEIKNLNEEHSMLVNKLKAEVQTANRETETAARTAADALKEKETAVVSKQTIIDQYAEAFSKLLFAAFNQIMLIKNAHHGNRADSVLAKAIGEKIVDNYSYGLEEFAQACEKAIAEHKSQPAQLRSALRGVFTECLRLDSANWMNVLARLYLYCRVPFIAKQFVEQGLDAEAIVRAFAAMENLMEYCGIKISYPALFAEEYDERKHKLQSIRNIDTYVPNVAEYVMTPNTIVDLYLLGYDDGEQSRQPIVSKFA